MKFSNPDFLKQWEGYSDVAYKDSGGVWTIGYGHTSGVKPGMKITKEQALAYLESDLAWATDAVTKGCKRSPTQNQFDAYTSLCYNIGAPNFLSSTTLKRFNAGNITGAADALTWWNKDEDPITGKLVVVRGLVNRRAAEKELFLTPDSIIVPTVDTRQVAIDSLFEEFKKRLMEILNG